MGNTDPGSNINPLVHEVVINGELMNNVEIEKIPGMYYEGRYCHYCNEEIDMMNHYLLWLWELNSKLLSVPMCYRCYSTRIKEFDGSATEIGPTGKLKVRIPRFPMVYIVGKEFNCYKVSRIGQGLGG